jgi:hypothetical protein
MLAAAALLLVVMVLVPALLLGLPVAARGYAEPFRHSGRRQARPRRLASLWVVAAVALPPPPAVQPAPNEIDTQMCRGDWCHRLLVVESSDLSTWR